jgi:chromosome segregation ATPase
MLLLMTIALILGKADTTDVAAVSGVALAIAALVRAFTLDPRASRLAERKENADLRREVDELYEGKRAAEDREREARRRLDKAERDIEIAEARIARLTGELDGANTQITELQEAVRRWRGIAGDVRRRRFEEE